MKTSERGLVKRDRNGRTANRQPKAPSKYPSQLLAPVLNNCSHPGKDRVFGCSRWQTGGFRYLRACLHCIYAVSGLPHGSISILCSEHLSSNHLIAHSMTVTTATLLHAGLQLAQEQASISLPTFNIEETHELLNSIKVR